MRKIREILRLKWVAQRSHREAARSLGVSPGAVASAVEPGPRPALTWEAVEALSDDALERTLYGPTPAEIDGARPEPDLAWIHQELRRPGVTLELLHVEYLAAHPTGYRYSAFCDRYRAWRARQRLSMRQVHKAGEKAFVDYAGMRPTIVDAATGEVIAVELFVAVLGASNYTFAEATRTQQSADWIASHVHAVEYFGGVPAVWVPDQLRTGVTVPCRYEPGVQRTYAEWAQHYHTVVIPARPAKPRDKAKVEVAVQVAERWILARLRHETFFSLAALNARIAELLTALNARPMKGYGGRSRRDLFEQFDRPALQALPAERFVHADWLQARVNIDYHVEVDRHYYSVPLSARARDARRPPLGDHGRDLPARHADLGPSAQPSAGPAHHGGRAHAESASRASGMESVAPRALGRHDRPGDRDARAADSRESSASRAGLSILSRAAAPGETLRPGPVERRVRPGGRRRRAVVSPRRFDAQARPRSAAAADSRPQTPAPSSRTTTSAVPRTTTKESPHDDDDP